MPSSDSVTINLDGREVRARSGSTVLETAREAGVRIPTLCYHEGLGSYQACRICTVEVRQNGRTRLQASCSLPVSEGMEILTSSDRVNEGRRLLVELILARSPGTKAVIDLARELGVGGSEFSPRDEDCILCGLCVRACEYIMGVGAIGFSGRGVFRKVDAPFGELTETCRACGACTYVCPTGKMQMEAEQVANFRQSSGWHRQCRYVRMGYFSYKVCHNNFQCWRCEVDQSIEEHLGTHAAIQVRPGLAGEASRVGEFAFVPDLFYHDGHCWARPLGEKIRIGIDDFAARIMSPVTDVTVPEAGTAVAQDSDFIEVFSGERRLVMPCPVSGKVVDVNPDVLIDPGLAPKSPYDRGWLATVEPDGIEQDMVHLYTKNSAMMWMLREREKLLGRFEGGEGSSGDAVLASLPQSLEDDAWAEFARDFFSPVATGSPGS
jgi:glycine cleavage system H lipoate-binding protein/ferredoxin